MKLLSSFFLFALPSIVLASNSLIRVDCQEDTNGAAVYLDDTYQFQCEDFAKLPILTTAGEHTLKVVRPQGEEYEQVFTKTVELKAGVPQRIRVSLPEKTLTDYGKKREAMRKEEARIAAEEAKKKRQEEARLAADRAAKKAARDKLKQILADARAGNVEAMRQAAERYRTGNGVPQDEQKAAKWERQAAIQPKIDAIEASKLEYFEMSETALLGIYGDDPGSSQILFAPWIVAPTFTAELVSSPVTSTNQQLTESQLEDVRQQTNAARWANPDSLIARAADRL